MSSEVAKRPMSHRKHLAVWVPVLGGGLVLVVAANVLLGVYSHWVASQLGAGTHTITNADAAAGWDTAYYASDHATAEEATAAAEAVAESIEAEGVVLLKNAAHALPLRGDGLRGDGLKVTLLGRGAADPVYGGAGSGSTDTSTAVDVRAGLERAGLEVNGTVYDLLADHADAHPRGSIAMDSPAESTHHIGEMPVAGYTDAAVASFADYGDAAVVVVSRAGGEGGDLATSMAGWDEHHVASQHQLELSLDERQTIALAEQHFETVVVLVNASTSMELGPVQDDPGVDAVLQVGSPGQSGFIAVGQVLTGAVNPSGRTVDLYAADFTQDPTFPNVGDFQYTGLDSPTGDGYLVQYEEGVYLGYRYYETAAVEGFLDYDQAVVYPFGHGLSYTSFDWQVTGTSLGGVDGRISVDVEVANTGAVAGKDVVELYYSPPYTPGGIEKPAVVLGAFEKTRLLAPGESQTLTLDLAVEDLASYDHRGERAYVLEAGDYQVTLRTDSHTVAAGIEPITYTVDETVVYRGANHRSSDDVEATNQFDDVSAAFTDTPEEGKGLNLSRADFAGTFPTAPTSADLAASDEVVAGFAAYDHAAAAAASDAEMPTQGAAGDLGLIDLRGLDHDDPQWESLLDQLTVEEMTDVILNGAYQTGAIGSIAKQATSDVDGPAGFSSFINDAVSGVAYPSQVVVGQTWNTGLAHAMGVAIGDEGLALGANGWYAPAVNLHRSPFGGRNFEYYSEDPVLSGELAAQVVSGAASQGVYAFVKHFALNDQEAHRVDNGIATWANEQAIREIYLKPFEIALKNASAQLEYLADDEGTVATREIGATAVMSSFNRIGATWAGGSEALMSTVLRDEWGFRGMAITDFNLYGHMDPDQGLKAGSDLMLTFQPMKSLADTTSAEAVSNIREATHNILYTVANSNAMNGIAPGAELHYSPPAWRYWQVAVSAVVGILLALGTVRVVRRVRTGSDLSGSVSS
ncbi:glycoside hydrolase family 3 N-terminal domain-containing protein [Cellulomonas cellasea]|uniref:glycoside hydrolase family 3 C-terminal domain-containing protein n=1 Tax=Cellulomonas cellasea TaxID=43670 RepID=UPI0025A45DA2|nr:glycoside hydrolase family 3 N-terminal domain-containing protein [Cellulomonas cellasea]MDM8084486.1 glycoside hydrolase family 3 N-terminal domain-containing protein [Cellulomonas cellasea]